MDRHPRFLGRGCHQAQGRQVPLLLQLLRNSARGPVHRAAFVPGHRGVGSNRRSLRGPGHIPAVRHERGGNSRGLRTRRRHQLRRAHHAEHHRSRRVLRQARQAVDGVRLLLGRHLHPRDGRGHRQTQTRTGLRQASRRRRSLGHRRAVHALQPGVGLLLSIHVLRRAGGERRLQHPHRTVQGSRQDPSSTPRAATWSMRAAASRTSRPSA